MKPTPVIITNGDKRPLIERPLVIAVQFWGARPGEGDRDQALALARLIADIEPTRRDDVALVFAQRFDVQMGADIFQTQQHCGQKFPIFHVRSEREQTGHPNGCFGLWAGTAEQCYRNYCQTWPYHSVFFCEADGVPLRRDWIDVLKKRHAETLAIGKRITGHVVPESRGCCAHVNGSFVMHMSCWPDHPSLQVCRRDVAWDVFHAQTLLGETNDNRAIRSLYGVKHVSKAVFETLANESAWLAGVKDGSARQWAEQLRVPVFKIEKRNRPRRKRR